MCVCIYRYILCARGNGETTAVAVERSKYFILYLIGFLGTVYNLTAVIHTDPLTPYVRVCVCSCRSSSGSSEVTSRARRRYGTPIAAKMPLKRFAHKKGLDGEGTSRERSGNGWWCAHQECMVPPPATARPFQAAEESGSREGAAQRK